jgi:diguanylate cyclase (GGDEF)-like protein/PAS domain S-box-containing protein
MKDSSKTKQALIVEISVLKKRIQELENSEAERKRVKEALRERNKELNCLYAISALLELPGISLDEILKGAVMLIPPAWQFPEITEASIVLEGKIFQTARFRETSWMQAREVIVNGMPVGQVEVCYLEERQASDEGPFLKEERKLLNAIAERLGRITERKRVEEAVRESEERYRALVENASDIVFRLDDTGHVTYVNPAALRITGYEEKEIIGRHYPTFIRQDMREEAMRFFGRQFVKGIPNTYTEYPVIVKNGHELWFGQNTQLIFQDGKVVAFQAVARDITDRKQAEEALRESEERYRELSIIDGLTQLYNSRHFYHQLKMEIDRVDRYGQPLTLLLLDLDDFKAFNDAYGHVEGDQVLFRLGQVVKRCLRETDSAYRYGGEEFTILLPMTTSENSAVTAERIRTEFKKELFSPAPGQDVHVTVSIGLAQYKTKEDMKAFVHRADQLMYQGKKNGKDSVRSAS